jgi:lipoyl-dependent peroxiredoxin
MASIVPSGTGCVRVAPATGVTAGAPAPRPERATGVQDVAEALVETIYTTTATVEGGRRGRARSDDGALDVALVPPGDEEAAGTGTNPEQLFAAGYGACFQSALALVGERDGVDTSASRVDATVSLGRDADERYGLAVTLRVTIPGVDVETARRLVETTHQVCPYSRATRGNIDVTLEAFGG